MSRPCDSFVISTYTFHLHFSFILLAVVFTSIWRILLCLKLPETLHKSCRNAYVPCEASMQLLQAMTINQARAEKSLVRDHLFLVNTTSKMNSYFPLGALSSIFRMILSPSTRLNVCISDVSCHFKKSVPLSTKSPAASEKLPESSNHQYLYTLAF